MSEMTVELTADERLICLSAIIRVRQYGHKITGMPWMYAKKQEVNTLIEKLGIPNREEMVLVCPECGRSQVVKVSDYSAYLLYGGHPYTCADHTYMAMLPASMLSRNESP